MRLAGHPLREQHRSFRGCRVQRERRSHPYPSEQTRGITIRNNLFYDISTSSAGTGDSYAGDEPADIVVDGNTIIANGTSIVYAYAGTKMLSDGSKVAGEPITGFVYTNNLAKHGTYGFFTPAGPSAEDYAFWLPGATIAHNVFAGAVTTKYYPATNLFPTVAEFTAQFVDPATTITPGARQPLLDCRAGRKPSGRRPVDAAAEAGSAHPRAASPPGSRARRRATFDRQKQQPHSLRKGRERIQPCSLPSGKVARRQADDDQYGGRRDERYWIGGAQPRQQAGHRMRQQQRQRGAQDDSDRHQLQPLPEHASENAAGTGTERHSDPDSPARARPRRTPSFRTDRSSRAAAPAPQLAPGADHQGGVGQARFRGVAERQHIGGARRVDLRDHLFHILEECRRCNGRSHVHDDRPHLRGHARALRVRGIENRRRGFTIGRYLWSRTIPTISAYGSSLDWRTRFPSGFVPGKIRVGERLADNDNRRAALAVARVEVAPTHDRNAEGREVSQDSRC